MDTKQLGIICLTLVALVSGFVALAIAGVSTDGYTSFIVAAILPTIVAGWGAKNARQAKESAQRAESNTNGTLSRLLNRNAQLEKELREAHSELAKEKE